MFLFSLAGHLVGLLLCALAVIAILAVIFRDPRATAILKAVGGWFKSMTTWPSVKLVLTDLEAGVETDLEKIFKPKVVAPAPAPVAAPQPSVTDTSQPPKETLPVSIEDTVKADVLAVANAFEGAAPKVKALVDNAVTAARADEQKIAAAAKAIADKAATDAKAAYDATIAALQGEVATLKSKWAAFEASLTPPAPPANAAVLQPQLQVVQPAAVVAQPALVPGE